MFFRLWTRAPCTAIVVRAAAFGVAALRQRGLAAIATALPCRRTPAPAPRRCSSSSAGPASRPCRSAPGRPDTRRRWSRRSTSKCRVKWSSISLARPRLAGLAQVVEHRREQRRRALGHDSASTASSAACTARPRLLRVEQVGVDGLEERRVQRQRLRDHLAVGEQAARRSPRSARAASRRRGSTARCSRDRRA